MLKRLFRFELRYHLRQVTFLVALVLYLVLGFLMSKGNFGGTDLHKNSPYVITYIVSLLSLFSIFLSTVFCAGVVLRDQQWQMDALVFSSGLTRWQWFSTRLLGLVLAVFSVLAVAMPGCWLGWSMVDTDQLGQASFAQYAWPLLILGFPDVFFCCSLVFAAAVLGRNVRSVYATGVLLFILYFVGSILGNSPLMAGSVLKTEEPSLLPYLMDPFGIMSFFDETRNWTVAERNERLFPLSGVFLLNRLIWLLISFLLLLISYKGFQFRMASGKKKKKDQAAESVAATAFQPVVVQWPVKRYELSVFAAQLRLETASLFRHLPFLFLLLLWIFLFVIDLKEEALEGPYGIRYQAITGIIVEKLRSMNPALFFLVLYASELLHREHASKMQGLVFSTPAGTGVLWAAKLTTLLLLIMLLVTVNIVIGISTQLFAGHVTVELHRYGWLYYYSAFPLFLYAVLIFFVQSIVRNRFLGMMLSLVLCGVFVFGKMLGLRSPLLRYAMLPDLRFSDMNSFGHYADAVHWYLLYWACLAFVLAWVAALLWRRFAAGQKMKMNKNAMVVLSVAMTGWIASGVFIYSRTAYDMSRNSTEWRKDYELKYGNSRVKEQPLIRSVKTKVDIYPEHARYTVQGKYMLKNESSESIDTLWLGVSPQVDKVQFNISNARMLTADAGFNQYRFLLARPLQPGDSMELEFSTEASRGPFTRFNSEHSVLSNGTYIELEKYLPWLGYNPMMEVDDPEQRRIMKLRPQLPLVNTDSGYYFVDYETEISTEANQQVVTVGSLQKEWHSGNRKFASFKSGRPIPFMFAISSARYEVMQEEAAGIQYSIYYQRGHEENIPVMMQGMKDAVAYGNSHFSPYPFPSLRMAEVPHYPGAATAYPGALFSAERICFHSDHRDTGKFNTIYTVAAHEAAHQWWADILSPQVVPGRAMLTESLSTYTEILLAEKRFGKEMLQQQMEKYHQLYFNLRNMNSEQEKPMLSSGQSFVYYQKGGPAFYAIQQQIGETRMQQALQRLLQKHAVGGTRPVPADLLRELLQDAAADEQQFILDQLQRVILYDAGMKLVSCTQRTDGKWELQLKVLLSKWDHTNGKPVKVPPKINIMLAVSEAGSAVTAFRSVLVSREQEIISLVLNKKPSHLMLDPLYNLPDENRGDNRVEIP